MYIFPISLFQADLSETQQDILDMNQRYEMLEERLLDRQQELQGMLDTVKSFLQDLSDVSSWLDIKEKDVESSVAIATSEKEARRRLKEHEVRILTLVLLNPDIPCLCKHCRSRSVGLFRICTVCNSVCEFISTIWIK